MLRINRKSAYADKLRSYKIVLDDKIIGAIAENETKDFDLKSGSHVIYLKIDWARSNKISFNNNGSELVELEAVSVLAGGKVIFALFYVIFLSTKWIKLTRIHPKS
jgi:hypothetical protein